MFLWWYNLLKYFTSVIECLPMAYNCTIYIHVHQLFVHVAFPKWSFTVISQLENIILGRQTICYILPLFLWMTKLSNGLAHSITPQFTQYYHITYMPPQLHMPYTSIFFKCVYIFSCFSQTSTIDYRKKSIEVSCSKPIQHG